MKSTTKPGEKATDALKKDFVAAKDAAVDAGKHKVQVIKDSAKDKIQTAKTKMEGAGADLKRKARNVADDLRD